MRIAWCTPFSRRSGIGEFSAVVVSELRRLSHIDVDILYPVGSGGRVEPDPGLELQPPIEETLADYDTVYYNIGDSWGYHAGLVRAIRKVPGIVVLHDVSLTHLMITELLKLDGRELTRVLVRLYGPPGVGVAESLRTDPGWPWHPDTVESHPLLGLVLEPALGVITHSEYAAIKVRREYAGDVWNVPLPSLPLPYYGPGKAICPSDFDDRPIVLQAGVINGTKCVSTVVDAFALAGISDRAQLVICGFAEPHVLQGLRDHIARLRLSNSIRIMGSVSDEVLDFLRRRATLATVLRYPIVEAASKVLLDSMAYGLAVLTVNSGHYVEVPDDTVLRVESPPSAEDVAAVLSYAIGHPRDLHEMAERGRLYIHSRRTPSRYAQDIIGVAQEAGAVQRRKELASDLSDIIQRIGFGVNDSICDHVVTVAAELFGSQATMAHEIY